MSPAPSIGQFIRACAALLLFVALGGCQSITSTPSVATGPRVPMSDVAVWNTPEKADAVPGIDYAAVTYYHWDDRLVFALWVDTNNNLGDRKYGKFSCEGSIDFVDRRPSVKFECKTPDGRSGTLTVDGRKFELSDGLLILVTTSGGKVRLKQLQREAMVPLTPSGTPQSFETWKTDPEIAEFFAKEEEAN